MIFVMAGKDELSMSVLYCAAYCPSLPCPVILHLLQSFQYVCTFYGLVVD
jgi:hypothetical protein